MDRRGRATGEAFVQFESQDDTEQALGRNREKIGHRWVSYTSYLPTTTTTAQQPINIQHSNGNMNQQQIKLFKCCNYQQMKK